MKQLSTFLNVQEKSCVFTGHRILDENFSEKKLYDTIQKKIKEGVFIFYNGLAVGFDLLAAEFVLSFKKKNPNLRLIACIPCQSQADKYSKKNQARYQNVLTCADEVVRVSEQYYKGCMHARDRYMAEHADCMITYCKKKEGGTAYTVRYFQKIRPEGEILFL